jgi:hypothetical protein
MFHRLKSTNLDYDQNLYIVQNLNWLKNQVLKSSNSKTNLLIY